MLWENNIAASSRQYLGEEIKITANGHDAKEAVSALVDLVNHKFGEEI